MIVSVFFNVLYLTFPFFIYIIYLICSKALLKKEKNIFFDLALISSFYLCCKFGEFNYSMILLINIPLLLALFEKRILISFVLFALVPFFLLSNYDIFSEIIYIEYFLVLIACLFTSFDKVNCFVLIKFIFSLILVLIYKKSYDVIIIGVLLYVVFYVVIYLYSKLKKVIGMFYSLEELTKEKQLYESLFKITHEIKNPLAVCKGYLDMFNIKDEKRANKYINIINQEVDRTLFLLKDFSDVSKMKIEKTKIDVTNLLYDIIDEASLMFDNKITFDFNVIDEEVFINADYNRLKQVLVNIIKNAKESIEECGNVSLTGSKVGNKYIICIKDDGIGMDDDTKEKIGSAFFTTKKNGTGLGVCLSKEIIRKHNGSIQYNSKLNSGTKVKIILPIIKK